LFLIIMIIRKKVMKMCEKCSDFTVILLAKRWS